MAATITITTDFGLADGYVAAMKGAILSVNPSANIVDITHQIAPQNIKEAAFILSTVYRYFPRGTIHLAIIDPGVGTRRKAIILRTPVADFVAPDNGVLSYIVKDFSGNSNNADIPAPLVAVAISNPRYWRSPVSRTFHGRDIFAPVAAHLSLGLPPAEFGESITSVTILPLPVPRKSPDGTISGEVIHIDGFGNLITDITEQELPGGTPQIEIGNKIIKGISTGYRQSKGLLAYIGSSGYLEIAITEGNAAMSLGAGIGSKVRVREHVAADSA